MDEVHKKLTWHKHNEANAGYDMLPFFKKNSPNQLTSLGTKNFWAQKCTRNISFDLLTHLRRFQIGP